MTGEQWLAPRAKLAVRLGIGIGWTTLIAAEMTAASPPPVIIVHVQVIRQTEPQVCSIGFAPMRAPRCTRYASLSGAQDA